MKKSLFIVLMISFLLSACQAATPVLPSATPAPLPTKAPATATEAPKPSATAAPTATLLPTATLTLAPSATATQTLTPTPAFAGFRILYSDYQKFGLLMVFSIPGMKDPYNLTVNNVKYNCTLQEKLPGQLFCMGPDFPHNRKVDLAFFAPNQTQPAYKTEYVIAPIKTPTPEGYIPPGNSDCPVRGIGASCETENRPATWPGGPCIVSTCVDICGYWYSIDTCGN